MTPKEVIALLDECLSRAAGLHPAHVDGAAVTFMRMELDRMVLADIGRACDPWFDVQANEGVEEESEADDDVALYASLGLRAFMRGLTG